MVGKPLRDEHLFGNSGLMKFNARVRQLLARLYEIARIGPQTRVVKGNHQICGFCSKTGNPLYLLPARRKVFAQMRVSPGDNDSIPIAFAHNAPQRFNSVCVSICHNGNKHTQKF